MTYQFYTHITSEEHDTFVTQHPYCNLLQSSKWANIKNNWDHAIVGVKDEQKNLVASCLVLIKPLPLGFTMFYTPRGPILDFKNEKLVRFFFDGLKKFAKKHHCLFIKLDPGFLKNSYHLEEKTDECLADSKQMMDNLTKCGCIHLGFSNDMSSTIQPRFHANMLKEGYSEDHFAKRCKKMLKIAEKKKVQIHTYGKEKIEDFTKVMMATTERKNISLRDQEYFARLLDTYQDDAFLVLASLNLKEIYEETQARYQQNRIDLENCKENQAKKRFTLQELHDSLTRELSELQEFLKTDGDEVVIAGTLSVVYGPTSEILYAGMDERYKRYMAPYITWKKTFEACFDKGCTSSNMGGIEGTLDGGLTQFKSNFDPIIQEYVGEFELPVNKFLYHLAHQAFILRKKLLSKKQTKN